MQQVSIRLNRFPLARSSAVHVADESPLGVAVACSAPYVMWNKLLPNMSRCLLIDAIIFPHFSLSRTEARTDQENSCLVCESRFAFRDWRRRSCSQAHVDCSLKRRNINRIRKNVLNDCKRFSLGKSYSRSMIERWLRSMAHVFSRVWSYNWLDSPVRITEILMIFRLWALRQSWSDPFHLPGSTMLEREELIWQFIL